MSGSMAYKQKSGWSSLLTGLGQAPWYRPMPSQWPPVAQALNTVPLIGLKWLEVTSLRLQVAGGGGGGTESPGNANHTWFTVGNEAHGSAS